MNRKQGETMGSWEDIRREARETWDKSWAEIKS